MRLLLFVLSICVGFGAGVGADQQIEVGVLTCSLGQTADTQRSDPGSPASEAREMRCTFKPAKNAPEETYVGKLKSVSGEGTLADASTMLWVVRVPVGKQLAPGMLQQSYAIDTATPAGQAPPLVGERNGEISLQSMADKEEGSAAQEKPTPPQFVITEIELVLKASAG